MIQSEQLQTRRMVERIESTMGNSNFSGNIKIAKMFGFSTAVFLQSIMSKRQALRRSGQIENDHWFWYRQEDIKNECGLSCNQQSRASKSLVEQEILFKERKGELGRNFFKINYALLDFIMEEPYGEEGSENFPEKQENQNQTPHPKVTGDLSLQTVFSNPAPGGQSTTTNTNIGIKPFSCLTVVKHSKEFYDENAVFVESSSFDQSSGSPSKELPSIQTNLDLSSLPVKRFGRNLSATSSISKPPTTEEATAGINALFSQQAKDARAERIAKRKQSPLQNINEEIIMLMEFWGSQGFKLPDPQKATKTYNKTIQAIKKVMAGNLIPGEKRKFNPDQIKESIAKFAMYVFDPCYGPPQNVKDRHIRKTGLKGFLYNSFGNGAKSYFIKFVDEEVQERKDIPMVPDKHPEVTNKLRNFFFAYPMAGIKKKLTEKEENHFRLASNKLDDLYKRKGHRFTGLTGGNHELAELLCSSIRAFYGDKVSRIVPGSFSSSFAHSCLIKYMNEKGYFTDDQSDQHWQTGS